MKFTKNNHKFLYTGTGKSLLASVVAAETRMTFLQVSASALKDKYVGESEKNVTALFRLAESLRPTLVFIDEIDSLCGSRDKKDDSDSR